MIFSPCLRSLVPVSVRSTIASTMSGTLASVAPCEGMIRALTPTLSKNRRVSSGNSVETRTPSGSSAPDSAGCSLGTARTILTGLLVALEYSSSPRETTSESVSVIQSRPVMPDVEQALLDVLRDLLRAQEQHLVDARVVDGGVVVAVGAAADGQVGGLEQLEGGLLERALRKDERQHGVPFGSDRERGRDVEGAGDAAVTCGRAA